MRVYLDHGATTPVDERVVEAMLPYMREKFGNASSLHSFGREASVALEGARSVITRQIGAQPGDFIFTSGGSESDNLALRGVAFGLKDKGGHIITSRIEHPAVLETCGALERAGFEVTYLNVDAGGFVNLAELESNVRKDTILVSVMHANNEIGTIQDLEGIGKLCRERGVLFHTDAVQSFTKTEFDVLKHSVDLASFSSHKIYGPKGVGGLYVRSDARRKIVQQITGGHHEFNLRAGTQNVAGAVGFAKAVEISRKEDNKKMASLRDYLIEGLLALPDSHLNGPTGERRLCNNANIQFDYVEGESILLMLDAKGIAVSTGSACSSQSLEPSHVLTALGCAPEESHGSIRLTLGRGNTRKEIEYVIDTFGGIIEQLRRMSPLVRRR